MSHVFISYSRKNGDYAYKLAARLRREGFEVWIDQSKIRGGDEWWEKIERAIIDCAAFIIIMSPDSKTSKWVKREIHLAENLDKPTFPLLLEGENWAFYGHKQFINVSDGNLPSESFYEALLESAQLVVEDLLNKQDRISNLDLLRTDGLYVYAPDLEYENTYPSDCTNYIYVQFIDRVNLKFFISSRFDISRAVQELEKSKSNTLVIRQNYLLFRHFLDLIINVYEDEIVISNDFTSIMPTSLEPFTADITCVGIYKFHSFE